MEISSGLVKRSGNKERCPTVAMRENHLPSCLLVEPSRVMGRITSRMAFSWTCQPKRKEVQAQRARDLMNWLVLLGQVQSLTRAGSQARMVRLAVARGEMLGRTEC